MTAELPATNERRRVLIVEDDDDLADLLVTYLGQHGLEPTRVATGERAAETILETRPDLVILDLMLPGANGLDICRAVRARFEGAILMLTASQSEIDHVAGLELGADDFVTKPIDPRVLLARIRTQLRRLGDSPARGADGRIELGTLVVDPGAREVRVDDDPVDLTAMEFDVLHRLARDAGTVVERDALYSDVMGVEYDGLDRGMDVHVSRIRRKLEGVGFPSRQLKSVRGVGYLLATR